jgi:hypothetical protein
MPGSVPETGQGGSRRTARRQVGKGFDSALREPVQPLLQRFEPGPGLVEPGAAGLEFRTADQVHALESPRQYGAKAAFDLVFLLRDTRRQRLLLARRSSII